MVTGNWRLAGLPSAGLCSACRDLASSVVVLPLHSHRLLDFCPLSPSTLQGMLAVKHSASASLLEFLVNSRPNCQLLGATPDRWAQSERRTSAGFRQSR